MAVTSETGSPPTHPFRAALVAGLATALLLLIWWWAADRPECSSPDVGSCLGSTILVAVVGVPAYLVAVWAGLRWAAATSPGFGLVVVLGATYAGVLLLEGIDPPLAVWPFVAAAVAGAYVALEARARTD